MQIAKSLDPVTVGKIKRSAMISAGGFIVAVIPMILPDVLSMLSQYPIAAAAIGAIGPWIVNTIREWLAGEPGNLGV